MNALNKTIALTALTLALGGFVANSNYASAEEGKEKCYGVAKAGKNDCASGKNSCAGSSKVDNDPQSFVAVPKGLCDKLVGGTTEAK